MGAPTITSTGTRLMCLDAFLLHFFTVLLIIIPPNNNHISTIQIVSFVRDRVNVKNDSFS